MTALEQLQAWFATQCDGDWEHANGVRIETLDNPGWSLEIDLHGTSLADLPFTEVEDRDEHGQEWLRCWLEGGVFKGASGPTRLTDMLRVFLDWSSSSHEQGDA